MESELGRLERLYHELSDEHLQDLASDQQDLTGDARTALHHELQARGFESQREPAEFTPDSQAIVPVAEPELEQGFTPGIPGVFPSSAAIMEQALEPAGEVVDGRARLISFFDGHELSRACETLEGAGITPEIESVAGDAMTGAPPRFDIWIAAGKLERAESLLRARLGLFPLPEEVPPLAPDPTQDELAASRDPSPAKAGEDDGMRVIAEFETEAEATQVVHVLTERGITARQPGQSDDPDGRYAVEVRAEDQDRALAVVSSELGVV